MANNLVSLVVNRGDVFILLDAIEQYWEYVDANSCSCEEFCSRCSQESAIRGVLKRIRDSLLEAAPAIKYPEDEKKI